MHLVFGNSLDRELLQSEGQTRKSGNVLPQGSEGGSPLSVGVDPHGARVRGAQEFGGRDRVLPTGRG